MPISIRTIQAGRSKPFPFTILILANPTFELPNQPYYQPDLILNYQAEFDLCADWICECLLGTLPNQTERLLTMTGRSAEVKIITVFETGVPAQAASALMHESKATRLLTPYPTTICSHIAKYQPNGVNPDIVFLVSLPPSSSRFSKTAFTLPSATETTPDKSRGGKSFYLDGVSYYHYAFCSEAGCIALDARERSCYHHSITPLHEFCHALGTTGEGTISDLYHDDLPEIASVNKRRRNVPTDQVPRVFATLNNTSFQSAGSHGWKPYPTNWHSFQCELINPNYPAIMDYYWGAAGNQFPRCGNDFITRQFLLDRLETKLTR